MRIAETLLSMAKWLESPNNQAILLSEGFEGCIDKVAMACVEAADVLKKCATEVDTAEGKRRLLIGEAKQLLKALSATTLDETLLTVEIFDEQNKLAEVSAIPRQALERLDVVELPADLTATVAITDLGTVNAQVIEKMAALAGVFDASEDMSLRKQASVLDEILLSISAPEGYIENFKAAQTKKIDELKKLYQEPNQKLHEIIGVEEAKKAIEKSEYNKEARPLEAPLSTRYCPDHAGSQIARVGNNTWQCSLDHKIYSMEEGFTDEQGRKHPPAGAPAISEQTKLQHNYHQIFDTRDQRLDKMR